MLPHPSSLKISHLMIFLKKLICVKVSEDLLSETSFQIQEAFPKLSCNNFNTDQVSMFIVYSRMPQFKNKVARCSAVQNGT